MRNRLRLWHVGHCTFNRQRLGDIPARLTFHDAPEEAVSIGSATVRAAKVTHQGPTVGYRIEEGGRVLVYLPDHEPSLGVHLRDQPTAWMSGYDVARDADILFHDAQYGDDEYPHHVGWGHSCIEHRRPAQAPRGRRPTASRGPTDSPGTPAWRSVGASPDRGRCRRCRRERRPGWRPPATGRGPRTVTSTATAARRC